MVVLCCNKRNSLFQFWGCCPKQSRLVAHHMATWSGLVGQGSRRYTVKFQGYSSRLFKDTFPTKISYAVLFWTSLIRASDRPLKSAVIMDLVLYLSLHFARLSTPIQ
ncbi:hypothetical protein OUZ56_020439 [Daphnia magna]|uniref:Uncharacterized protein n=1 Tax=Daphnia magna TaxID=35525 RepID=A0ABQ9ZEH0_9CRUS|nr:hypothetical protein OUZ56_020439 [Daphnia magna]